jgi:uncharacterized RDD family membrane protein YckC
VEIIVAISDKLIIDTPEQVHLEFTLAGIGSRFLALFVDTLIQGIFYIVVWLVGLFVTAGALFRSESAWTAGITVLVLFCVYWGYFATFEALWKGQTPGKRYAGIRVIKDSGRPIKPFEAVARNLLRIVDQIPGIYVVGITCMFFSKQNRRLGDYVAGTVVVHESSPLDIQPFFNTKEKGDLVIYQAARLTIPEIELIEAFLLRRLDIPMEIRRQNAARIAEKIEIRLGIDAQSRTADDENFLELVVKEFRNHARY